VKPEEEVSKNYDSTGRQTGALRGASRTRKSWRFGMFFKNVGERFIL